MQDLESQQRLVAASQRAMSIDYCREQGQGCRTRRHGFEVATP